MTIKEAKQLKPGAKVIAKTNPARPETVEQVQFGTRNDHEVAYIYTHNEIYRHTQVNVMK